MAAHSRYPRPLPARFFEVREQAPRRFYPTPGRRLTLSSVRGPWRPSGTVAGVGVFAVIWTTPSGALLWAPLHDFEAIDALRLIEACRGLDQEARHGYSAGRGQL